MFWLLINNIFLILIMAITIYFEHNYENPVKYTLKNLKEYWNEPNIRKYIGVNAIFTLILINTPTYYIWVYFRKNNYFAYEIFDYNFIIKFIGLENLFISSIFLIYMFLPISFRYIKKLSERIFIGIGILLIYLLFFIFIIEQFFINHENICAFLLFILSLAIPILVKFLNKNNQLKYFWLILVSVFIIIILPFMFGQAIVKKSLFNYNIGHFLVDTVDKKNMCLLIRANNTLYIKTYDSVPQEKILILSVEQAKLSYQINPKKYCS